MLLDTDSCRGTSQFTAIVSGAHAAWAAQGIQHPAYETHSCTKLHHFARCNTSNLSSPISKRHILQSESSRDPFCSHNFTEHGNIISSAIDRSISSGTVELGEGSDWQHSADNTVCKTKGASGSQDTELSATQTVRLIEGSYKLRLVISTDLAYSAALWGLVLQARSL